MVINWQYFRLSSGHAQRRYIVIGTVATVLFFILYVVFTSSFDLLFGFIASVIFAICFTIGIFLAEKRFSEALLILNQIISAMYTDSLNGNEITNDAFSIVENSQASVKSSVEQTNKVATVLSDIQHAIMTINQMTDQIATATEEQVVVASEISQNVSLIREAADSSAVGAEQISKTSHSQAELASDLQSMSASYKT